MIRIDVPVGYFESWAPTTKTNWDGCTPCYTLSTKYSTDPPGPILGFYWKLGREIIDWCESECTHWSPSAYYIAREATPALAEGYSPQVCIDFKYEIDAIKFKLRWH